MVEQAWRWLDSDRTKVLYRVANGLSAMPLHCESCGTLNPDSASFCHRCGALFSSQELEEALHRMQNPTCVRCGMELVEGGTFCPHCGSTQSVSAVRMRANELSRMSLMAKMLALVPGIFNIFGLGHLLLRSYLRALVFMALSGAIYLCEFLLRERDMMSGEWQTGLLVFSLLVFMVQLWDVFKITYRLESSR